MRKYGSAPEDFGFFVNPNPEMMFWMYCPISLAGSSNVVIPKSLSDYGYMVELALQNEHDWRSKFVYLTAKTLHVTPESMGNRHGWHADGFGTDDVNYIWSDRCPTEFLVADEEFELSDDHLISMDQMAERARADGSGVVQYPSGHILRLTPSVIHRVAADGFTGFRSFAKVTISEHKFDLAGNAVNHELAPNWIYHPRAESRNLETSNHE